MYRHFIYIYWFYIHVRCTFDARAVRPEWSRPAYIRFPRVFRIIIIISTPPRRDRSHETLVVVDGARERSSDISHTFTPPRVTASSPVYRHEQLHTLYVPIQYHIAHTDTYTYLLTKTGALHDHRIKRYYLYIVYIILKKNKEFYKPIKEKCTCVIVILWLNTIVEKPDFKMKKISRDRELWEEVECMGINK